LKLLARRKMWVTLAEKHGFSTLLLTAQDKHIWLESRTAEEFLEHDLD
jgi:hypothetical protein